MAELEYENDQVPIVKEPESSERVATFNFWEVNSYKTTVKRVEDGAKLCDDFMKLINERAEIEATYYNKMKSWSKKWEDIHTKGPEYGALKTAMYGIMLEGEQLADIHFELKEKLVNDVYQSVNQWKKDNYHKSLISYKEVKTIEEGFIKAQKPWSRRLDEVNKCKKTYYNSCRNLDTGGKQEIEGKLSEEQMKKLQQKIRKYKGEVNECKIKYEDALRDLTGYVSKYTDDMKYQFNKCQEFEEIRKIFFQNILLDYHKAVTRDEYFTRLSGIYNNMLETLKKTDSNEDLEWYASIYGTDAELSIPVYEEYDVNMSLSPNGENEGINDGVMTKRNKSGVCTTL